MFRTHDCNSLRKSDIGRQVTLAGWVNVTRDHGGVIFIDLRDREGLTQVVFRPEENAELAKQAHTLRGEDVIQVSGTVAARLPGTENPNLATGDIEIIPSELRILNRADPLPFPIDAEPQNEDLRMTHRYLDLRRPRLARNLRIRHGPQRQRAITSTARDSSKLKRRFCPRARRKARGISWCRAASRREDFTRCRRRRSNTNSCSWSRAWKNIFRSQNVFATKICAPTGNRSLRRSTLKRRSSRPTTSLRHRRNARGDLQGRAQR